jgi:hypothetical protein
MTASDLTSSRNPLQGGGRPYMTDVTVPSVGRSGWAGIGTGSTGAVASASGSTGGANLTGATPVSLPVRN